MEVLHLKILTTNIESFFLKKIVIFHQGFACKSTQLLKTDFHIVE